MAKTYTRESVDIKEREYIRSKLADRGWRLDNLYHIKNVDGIKIPFKRNESQLQLEKDMWWLNVILKDRQRGFSTYIAIYILDYCLFNSNTNAGVIDITLDDGKKKVGKMLFAYNNLPEWLKAEIPLKNKPGSLTPELLSWENGSSVYAGTSHRGDTLQLLHISEMGKIAARFPDRAREIRTGALNTVHPENFVFIESTAEGNSGEFYEYCKTARELQEAGKTLTVLDFKFHFFGWWMGSENELDPDGIYISQEHEEYFAKLEEEIGRQIPGFKLSEEKKAWYAKKEATQRDDMKREFPGTPDEAFEAAIEGVYLAKQLLELRKRKAITIVPIKTGIPINTGWDWGLNDTATIWLHQRVEFQDRLVGYLEGSDDDILYYWAKLQKDYALHQWGYHFLPHDAGHKRAGTAKSADMPPRTLEEILNEAGMSDTHIIPRIDHKITAITEVRNWLPDVVIDERSCEKGLKCLNNFRKAWDDVNGCWKDRPLHDWAMHGYDGLETLCRGLNAFGVKAASTHQTEMQQRRRFHRPPPNWRA